MRNHSFSGRLAGKAEEKNSSEGLTLRCVNSVVFTFHSREDVEWEAEEDSDTEEEEENSESEEENGVVNNTEEPEENLPSVAVSETVGEENEPEVQPREAEKMRSGRQTRPPRWHNDYARHLPRLDLRLFLCLFLFMISFAFFFSHCSFMCLSFHPHFSNPSSFHPKKAIHLVPIQPTFSSLFLSILLLNSFLTILFYLCYPTFAHHHQK